jgi:hypothetical protein
MFLNRNAVVPFAKGEGEAGATALRLRNQNRFAFPG